jgi:hypothetical protein
MPCSEGRREATAGAPGLEPGAVEGRAGGARRSRATQPGRATPGRAPSGRLRRALRRALRARAAERRHSGRQPAPSRAGRWPRPCLATPTETGCLTAREGGTPRSHPRPPGPHLATHLRVLNSIVSAGSPRQSVPASLQSVSHGRVGCMGEVIWGRRRRRWVIYGGAASAAGWRAAGGGRGGRRLPGELVSWLRRWGWRAGAGEWGGGPLGPLCGEEARRPRAGGGVGGGGGAGARRGGAGRGPAREAGSRVRGRLVR